MSHVTRRAAALAILTSAAAVAAAPAAQAAPTLALSSVAESPQYANYGGDRVAVIGDFNGDGKTDHAVTNEGTRPDGVNMPTAGSVTVYLGGAGSVDGGGTVKLESSKVAGTIEIAGAGDLDGDGFDDLLITSAGTPWGDAIGTESWLVYGAASNPATLTVASGPRVAKITQASYTIGNARGFGIGDFTGDGIDDIVLAAKTGSGVSNGVAQQAVIAGGPRVTTLDARVPGGRISHLSSWRDCQTYFISYFPYFRTTCKSMEPLARPIGDFDGDGKDDLFVALPDGSSQRIVLGRSGSFAVPVSNPGAGSVDVRPRVSGPVQVGNSDYWRTFRTAGDVNGDGKDDVIVPAGPPLSATVTAVLLGRANPPAAIPATEPLLTVAPIGVRRAYALGTAGDQNGDGRDDLLVVQTGGTPQQSTLHVAPAPTSGTAFESNPTPIEGSFPPEGHLHWQVGTPADLDGDGSTDLLLGNGAGAYRVTGNGVVVPPKPTLEVRTTVIGPTGSVYNGVDYARATVRCGTDAESTQTSRHNPTFLFGGDGSIEKGDRCVVTAGSELPTQYDFANCTWSTRIEFRGVVVAEGAEITIDADPNRYDRIVTCSAPAGQYPADFGFGWRRTGYPATVASASTLRLTDQVNQTTSAVWPLPLNFNDKVIEFTLAMKGGNGAAEGVTLAFLDPAAGGVPAGGWLGLGGGGLGFKGLGGLALAFDAYKQPEDAQANAVVWQRGTAGGDVQRLSVKDAGLRLRGTVPVPVKVTVKNGTITALVGNKSTHTVPATLPNATLLAFTGSSSPTTYQQQLISGLKITDAP